MIKKTKKSVPVKKAILSKKTPTVASSIPAKKTAQTSTATAKNEVVIINSPFWNIWDTGKTYKVRIPIAGLSKKDISVITSGNLLIISSEKKGKKEKNEKNYIIKQYSYSSWSKSINLPEKISDKDITLNYKDGVLRLEMNKI